MATADKTKMDPLKAAAAVFALLFVLDVSEPVEIVNPGPVSATASQGNKYLTFTDLSRFNKWLKIHESELNSELINDNFERFGRLFLRLGGDRLNALRRRQETQVR